MPENPKTLPISVDNRPATVTTVDNRQRTAERVDNRPAASVDTVDNRSSTNRPTVTAGVVDNRHLSARPHKKVSRFICS